MSRIVDLFLNLSRPAGTVLLAGRRDLTAAEAPIFVDGEKPTLRIQLLQPSEVYGEAPVVSELAAGDVLIFALKKRGGGALLAYGAGFVLTGAGNERRYQALVDFNTTDIVNAFGEEQVLAALGEVRIQNAANTARKTYQFRCTIQKRVYNSEANPAPATPVYPATESLLTNGTDTAAIKRGVVDLVAGARDGVAVAFATQFGAAPSLVRAWVLKKAGAAIIAAHENHDSVTAAGFTVDLAATVPAGTPAGDYKLAWLAVL